MPPLRVSSEDTCAVQGIDGGHYPGSRKAEAHTISFQQSTFAWGNRTVIHQIQTVPPHTQTTWLRRFRGHLNTLPCQSEGKDLHNGTPFSVQSGTLGDLRGMKLPGGGQAQEPVPVYHATGSHRVAIADLAARPPKAAAGTPSEPGHDAVGQRCACCVALRAEALRSSFVASSD